MREELVANNKDLTLSFPEKNGEICGIDMIFKLIELFVPTI